MEDFKIRKEKTMNKEEQHKEFVKELQSLEQSLIERISEVADDVLMNAFIEWQDKRNECNELFKEVILDILNTRPEAPTEELNKQCEDFLEDNNCWDREISRLPDDHIYVSDILAKWALNYKGESEKLACPECQRKVTRQELNDFGGLCEECSTDWTN